MGKALRFRRVLEGLMIIFCSLIFFCNPGESYELVVGVLQFMLMVYGIRSLSYYFSMARYMVGGQLLLFRGIILLDLGMFTWAISDVPRFFVILYLVCIHGAAGVIDILGGLEAKRFRSPGWKLQLFRGAVGLAVSAACIYSIRSTATLVVIFSAGLLFSGVTRITSAFRKTAVVYIQ